MSRLLRRRASMVQTQGDGGVSSASAAHRAAVLLDNPTAFWRQAAASGTTMTDEQGSHNGTYSNSPTLGAAGLMAGNTAVTFVRGSNQYATATTLGVLGSNLRTSSFAFIFKTSDTTNLAALCGTLNTGTVTAVQVLLNSNATGSFSSGSTQFFLRGEDGLQIQATISTNLYDGAFHYLVIVVESTTTVSIYVDKVAQTVTYGLQQAATSFANLGFPLVLAARNNRGTIDLPASVTLDEVAVFPTRLTSTRVAAHYDAAVGVGGGGGATAAPFPSRLVASGRDIVDENGYALGGPGASGRRMLGQNIHVVPWAQVDFNDMAAKGMTCVRVILLWASWQPTNGTSISTGMRDALDTTIARAEAAGLYVELEIHLNTQNFPSWATNTTAGGSSIFYETERLVQYGQWWVEWLYNRYGNQADPTGAGKYTKAVTGLNINEPPVADNTIRNGNTSNTWLEDQQKIIHGWHRAIGPNWIAYVATGYAQQTPIYDSAIGQNSSGAAANPSRYFTIGGNIVYDIHDYMQRDLRSPLAGPVYYDGRQFNGQIDPSNFKGVASENYTSGGEPLAEHKKFLAPFGAMAAAYNVPVRIGEWGWPEGSSTGETAWMTDAMAAWDTISPVQEVQWNYDVTPSNTVWCSYPNRVWRASTTAWATARA